MRKALRNVCLSANSLLSSEEGQDLVEYALVLALIAFAATAGMSSLASSINSAFSSIGGSVTTYTG
jgi:pilus assembly protein Flp/PilA